MPQRGTERHGSFAKTTEHIERLQSRMQYAEGKRASYKLLRTSGQTMALPWVSVVGDLIELYDRQLSHGSPLRPAQIQSGLRDPREGTKCASLVRAHRLPFAMSRDQVLDTLIDEVTMRDLVHEKLSTVDIKTLLIAPVHHSSGRIGSVMWAGPADIRSVEVLCNAAASSLLGLAHEGLAKLNLSAPDNVGPVPYLTARERECLHHAANGLHGRAIAESLNISSTTVRYHLDNCRRKLGAVSVAHAVALGVRDGLVGDVEAQIL